MFNLSDSLGAWLVAVWVNLSPSHISPRRYSYVPVSNLPCCKNRCGRAPNFTFWSLKRIGKAPDRLVNHHVPQSNGNLEGILYTIFRHIHLQTNLGVPDGTKAFRLGQIGSVGSRSMNGLNKSIHVLFKSVRNKCHPLDGSASCINYRYAGCGCLPSLLLPLDMRGIGSFIQCQIIIARPKEPKEPKELRDLAARPPMAERLRGQIWDWLWPFESYMSASDIN